MNHPPNFMDGLIGLVMIALFFFMARAFFIWYFKIDRVIALLASIDRKLGPLPEGEESPQDETLAGSLREKVRKRFAHLRGGGK